VFLAVDPGMSSGVEVERSCSRVGRRCRDVADRGEHAARHVAVPGGAGVAGEHRQPDRNKVSDKRVLRTLDLAHILLADNAEHVAACCRIEEHP